MSVPGGLSARAPEPLRRRGRPKRMPALVRAVLAVALLAALAPTARGQDAPPAGVDSALHAALQAVRPGSVVRVELAGDGSLAGPLLAVSADTLRLGGTGALPLDRLRTVWVRGRHTRRGATIGAIAGGAGGLAAGVFFGAVVAAVCEYDCPRPGHAMVVGGLLGGVGGALGGGVLGAIIGAAVPRWERRWP